MNILVAGGGGFIGSNLCKKLLAEGHSVWAVDNFLTGERENLIELEANPNFTFFECGVETPLFMEYCHSLHVRFDRVYDLACATGVPNIELLGEEMLDACSVGVKNLLTIAHEHGARFLLTSSSEIYGDPQVSPQSEDYTGNVDPIGWRANYEEGKRFAETFVVLFATKYKLKANIVRLFNVYGPSMALQDFRVIPRFAMQAIKGEPITVHGTGLQERTLCYVDDLVAGLQLVIEKGNSGEVYNLGGDQSITMLELANRMIAEANSQSPITFTPRASHDHESRMPVLTKVRALGWEQKVSLEDGLRSTINDFRKRSAQRESSMMVDVASEFAIS